MSSGAGERPSGTSGSGRTAVLVCVLDVCVREREAHCTEFHLPVADPGGVWEPSSDLSCPPGAATCGVTELRARWAGPGRCEGAMESFLEEVEASAWRTL